MAFASINPTNPRTPPWNFCKKILRIGGAGKRAFFKSAILNFFFQIFFFAFVFFQWKKLWFSYDVSFFSALWMVFPESWKRSCPNFYAHDCSSWKELFNHVGNNRSADWKKTAAPRQKSDLLSFVNVVTLYLCPRAFNRNLDFFLQSHIHKKIGIYMD